MDIAYDNVQKQSFPDDESEKKREEGGDKSEGSAEGSGINSEIQQAYKAISSSPWAAKLGGFWGTARKQGEQYYESARQEYTKASEQASTGVSTIISRARALSVKQPNIEGSAKEGESSDKKAEIEEHPDRPESLTADIFKEASGFFSRFKLQATERLKEVQRAEDAADEALLKFGSNVTNFFRDAVTIAPPEASEAAGDSSKILFESKDAEGKRVIHSTRFDAQLHVIHSSLDSFMKDPVSPEWKPWGEKFDIKAYTETISKDLEKFEELRKAMEKLVPEKVDYADFWKRYYFLRHVIESEEKRRKELLKASTNNANTEEVAWDEDSEEEEDEEESEDDEEDDDDEDDEEESDDDDDSDSDDEDDTSTPQTSHPLAASKETLKPGNKAQPTPKPAEPRKSGDQHSQASSDASYDVVSGGTSRTQGSPKGAKKEAVAEESDEDDWE